ncbi:MAG: hypothetical protein C0481_15985 [Phenylobacterium sp.]|uniref:DUF1801 domain-containing protein n=1 Tax=Phenylobacterium sp. TaxID=1871053 RepID=UPI0025D72E15|nr:DUF1801 domain-containing protein [Phenylobacterium sp.]MBA4013365.1 hypothetical protein [Phenylobacterium sp.]
MQQPSDIEARLNRHPEPTRSALKRLRRLILDTAAVTPGVEAIEEALRWGQPSYLTKTGGTIRIDGRGGSQYALYVHCQTDLLASFRDLYGDALTYDGKRALIFDAATPLNEDVVAHCIALALTYHSRKRRGA